MIEIIVTAVSLLVLFETTSFSFKRRLIIIIKLAGAWACDRVCYAWDAAGAYLGNVPSSSISSGLNLDDVDDNDDDDGDGDHYEPMNIVFAGRGGTLEVTATPVLELWRPCL